MKSSELARRYGIEGVVPGIRPALASVLEERYKQAVCDVEPMSPYEVIELCVDDDTVDLRDALVLLAVATLRRIEELDASVKPQESTE